MNRKDFEYGLLVGLVSLPTENRKKLVGYSYNGTILPKLPEHEGFVLIKTRMLSGVRIGSWLYVTQEPGHYSENDITESGETYPGPFILFDSGVISRFRNELGSNDWVEEAVGEDAPRIQVLSGDKIWSNYDLLRDDGSVYLEASEPVPVYE